MQLRKLNTESASDRRQFTRFPFDLYRGDPFWVPSMGDEMRRVLNRRRHPFYQHSSADFFVVENGRETLGRIAVLHHANYSQAHNCPTAFFYYFDAVNDQQVANQLFGAAFDWCRRRGVTLLRGPRGFLRSNGIGLLADGFDRMPATGIPYNFPYYPERASGAGLQKAVDYYSGYMQPADLFPERMYIMAEKVKQRNSYEVRQFNTLNELKRYIPLLEEIHKKAWPQVEGYYPTTTEEFRLIANNLLAVIDPKLVKLVFKQDKLVGFLLVYPNMAPAIKKAGGEIFPFGWITLLRHKHATDRVEANGIGLLPEAQGLGANVMLYTEIEKTLRAGNYQHIEFVQVNETNFLSFSDWKEMGVHWCKTHRLYEKQLD
jgi:GNAT superfamily N-acetyltransferase